MSKFLFNVLTLIFISTAGIAQTSFRVQLDSVENSYSEIAVGTAEGGFILTGIQGFWILDQASFVVKMDSVGNIEWAQKYPLPVVANYLESSDIIPIGDGGYYYIINQKDNMFDSYNKFRILKLDSSGSVQVVKESDWGPFDFRGNSIKHHEIEIGTKSLVSLGYRADYDGNGSTCCREYHLLKLDTLLNIELDIELFDSYTSAKICYLNGVNNGYILSMTKQGQSYITRLDTSGAVLWHKRYNYPGVTKITQKDSSFYLIGYEDNQAYIHKIDNNGNTIFLKQINHSHAIRLSDIAMKDSTTFILSGLIQLPGSTFWNFSPLLIESDTSIQFLNAKAGGDSLYTLTTINKFRSSIVFNKNVIYNPSTDNVHFENQIFDSTACSFSSINLGLTTLSLIDSTISLTTSPYTLVLNPSSIIPVNLNVTSTVLCLPTGTLEIGSDSPNKFNIYPNPSSEKLTIEFEATENEETELIIYDIAGSQVFTKKNVLSNETISVQNFNSGVYIVKVINQKINETKRLVIY